MDVRKLFIPVIAGKKAVVPDARFTVTTTGAVTFTIEDLVVITGKTVTVDWGDGSSNAYTAGSGAREHNYAGAGTWTVKITAPTDISRLYIDSNKVTLNSADIKLATNLTSFKGARLKAGRFDSADISAWRLSTLYFYSAAAGFTGTFNSSDVSAWRPTVFYLGNMPSGYAGTFNSSDISAWRPSEFYLYSMPAGFAGTFTSSDVSAWNPVLLHLYSMPVATFTIVISVGGFATWKAMTQHRMQGNSLNQTQVNQILADYWTAFATRTGVAGDINVGGTNAAPSGTLQAANPPTTGKEFAYELVNDSQNVNPTKKWTTITITA